MNQSIIQTEWRPVEQILLTRVAGIFRQEQVEEWERSLERTSRQIPKNLTFFMLVDIRGYEVSEQEREVHQLQRIIIPTFLARHGFEVGFFRLFDVHNTISIDPERARCVAVAHVHHDCEKMALYNHNLGRATERFFGNLSDAEEWLRGGFAHF